MKIKRELIGHLIDYGYIVEKATTVLIAISFLIVAIVIPAWPATITNYMQNPVAFGLPSLGNALLISTLLLVTGLTAFIIPHFEPLFRPHGFREVKDKRMTMIYLSLVSAIVSITILIYLIFAVTLII